MTYSYCPAWPEELKEAKKELQSCKYLISSLEAKLTRVEPESIEYFETLAKIEATQENLFELLEESTLLEWKYNRTTIEN